MSGWPLLPSAMSVFSACELAVNGVVLGSHDIPTSFIPLGLDHFLAPLTDEI